MTRQTSALKALATFAALNVMGLTLLHCRPALAELAVGAPAPEFSLQDVAGKTRTLAELHGKIVVLEWVNPNCPFSRRHATEKTMVSTEHRHPDVVWLGINSTSKGSSESVDPAGQKKYDAEKGIDYDVLFDPAGSVGQGPTAEDHAHVHRRRAGQGALQRRHRRRSERSEEAGGAGELRRQGARRAPRRAGRRSGLDAALWLLGEVLIERMD